jgi:AraC-like DNA-binding protein
MATVTVRHASTAFVPPADRVSYWEDHNRSALVGLTCTPYAESGLSASQTNTRVGRLWLTEITGNEHVIERTPAICRTTPKESVFLSLVLSGEAVFFRPTGVLPMSAGQLVLYHTDRPYLFAFTRPMNNILVDVPYELFVEHCQLGDDATVFGDTPAERALVSALADLARAGASEQSVLELVRSLVHSRTGGPVGRAAAIAYIKQHLAEPELAMPQIAAALGISVRQLNRIMDSPSRYILEQRLLRAHQDLANPGTIANVAHRWGFASQAHFTRVFRERFGYTPGEARRHALTISPSGANTGAAR